MLGSSPKLAEIAACLAAKISTTHSGGAFALGSTCIGSVVAYEMATQLKAAGYDIPLLIMLDAPSQSSLQVEDTIINKLSHPLYLLRRLKRQGFKKSLSNFRLRLTQSLPSSVRDYLPPLPKDLAHTTIVTSATDYYPERYDGNVLLLLANEKARHLNFYPQWASVIGEKSLHYEAIEGSHRELINPASASSIARIVETHLDLNT